MIFMPYRVASETRTAKGLPLEEHIPPTHTEHKKNTAFFQWFTHENKKNSQRTAVATFSGRGPLFLCAQIYMQGSLKENMVIPTLEEY